MTLMARLKTARNRLPPLISGQSFWVPGLLIGVQAIATAVLSASRFLLTSTGRSLPGEGLLQPANEYIPPFAYLIGYIDWPGAAVGMGCLVFAFGLAARLDVKPLVVRLGNWPAVAAAVVGLFCAILCLIAHHAYPFTMDEYAPVFQSEIFAQGRLTGQWPPPLSPLLISPEFKDYFLNVSYETGATCSNYSPGHALLLTPFTALGVPWALNPCLAGLAVLLLAGLARELYGREAVGWAVLFALGSPVFFAYSMSFYAMLPHLVCNLAYAWLLVRPSLGRVAAAGLLGGFALVLHNPFPHFCFALPWLIWLAWRPERWRWLPVIGASYALVFLPIDAGWSAVKRGVKQPPVVKAVASEQATNSADAPEPASGPTDWQRLTGRLAGYLRTLTLPSIPMLINGRTASLLRLIAWNSPGLLVLAACGWWVTRQTAGSRLLAASAVVTFLAYALIPMSGGHGWGYRYFFPVWGSLPLLAAGLAVGRQDSPGTSATEAPAEPALRAGAPWLLRVAGLTAVLSLVCCLPLRAWQIHTLIGDQLTQRPTPARRLPPDGDLVFFIDPSLGYFRSDLIRNDPFLDHGPFTFVGQGLERDREVMKLLGENLGLQSRLVGDDQRGSVWLMRPEE
jgi:hypothetical protein